jgi:hypothetical protein
MAGLKMTGQKKIGRLSIFAPPERLSNSDGYKVNDPVARGLKDTDT